MLFGSFKKIIYGNICFEVTDGFIDLFIEECRKTNTELHNVKADTCCIKAECEEKYLNSVRICAEKSKCNFKINNRKGIPFLLYRYSKRAGILIGLLLSVIMIILLNGRIWEVSIAGNELVSADEIRNVLTCDNVKVGALRSSIDAVGATEHLKNKIPKIYWASVNLIGTKAVVELRERIDIPEIEDASEYSNIVARSDGQIVRADVFAGESNVKPGMAVVKGDLLVSGVDELKEGNRFIRTEADITARTHSYLTSICLKNKPVDCLQKSKDIYLIYFLGGHFPFDIVSGDQTFTVNDYAFTSENTVFPFGIAIKRKTEMKEDIFKWNKNRGLLKCYADLSARFFLRYKNSDIEKIMIEIKNTGNITVSTDCICVENICEKHRIFVDKNE